MVRSPRPARLVNIDHDTPMLLPPDLRQWVPVDHLVHFIMDAVGELHLYLDDPTWMTSAAH